MVNFLTLCFVLFTHVVFAQTHTLDSLINIRNTQKEDTHKVNTLNSLWRYSHLNSDYKAALSYAEQALALSEDLHFRRGLALSHRNVGTTHVTSTGSFPEAMKHLKKSLEL